MTVFTWKLCVRCRWTRMTRHVGWTYNWNNDNVQNKYSSWMVLSSVHPDCTALLGAYTSSFLVLPMAFQNKSHTCSLWYKKFRQLPLPPSHFPLSPPHQVWAFWQGSPPSWCPHHLQLTSFSLQHEKGINWCLAKLVHKYNRHVVVLVIFL